MEELFKQHSWILILIILWSIPWKGVALWKSTKRGHKGWFIALLIVNSLAILDIIYIFIFSKKEEKKKDQQKIKVPVQIIPNQGNIKNIV